MAKQSKNTDAPEAATQDAVVVGTTNAPEAATQDAVVVGAANAPEIAAQDESKMIVAEQVLIITAPGGPRRRAGFSFGPEPVELKQDQLGETGAEAIKVFDVLRADPLLKIDVRFIEVPADD